MISESHNLRQQIELETNVDTGLLSGIPGLVVQKEQTFVTETPCRHAGQM